VASDTGDNNHLQQWENIRQFYNGRAIQKICCIDEKKQFGQKNERNVF
jgi:hypothetical protein